MSSVKVGTVFWWMVWACSALGAGKDMPSVDTIPPRVQAVPAERYQNRMFQVTITSSEPGAIRASSTGPAALVPYTNPITVATEGRAVVYFEAEDLVGNRSRLDSVVYLLDTRAPQFSVSPEPGVFGSKVTLRYPCSEPARFFRSDSATPDRTTPIGDSLLLAKSFRGYITALDSAGNMTRSRYLSYVIDTVGVKVAIDPAEGVFNAMTSIRLRTDRPATILYSFDPVAPPEWFKTYTDPVELPHGLTLVRYMARTSAGVETRIGQASFLVDTVSPRIRVRHAKGRDVDTLELLTKENCDVYYSATENGPIDTSGTYRAPLLIAHQGKAVVRAFAVDRAGNVSDIARWEQKYDFTPPTVSGSRASGEFTRPFTLTFTASEPVRIQYTLDGTTARTSSLLYSEGIHISRGGVTKVRFVAFDEADNASEEQELVFDLDLLAPKVRAQIEGNVGQNEFLVTLATTEKGQVYYELGDRKPDLSSPRYVKPIAMKTGQTLRYIAVDDAGNMSDVFEMNDLRRPMVNISPDAGMYARKLRVKFETNMRSVVQYRLYPDTAFTAFRDSLVLDKQGLHTLEYFSETPEGLRSPLRRNEYLLDWTAPHVEVRTQKGLKDSVVVFFESTENATIYYTVDGTSPMAGTSVLTAGNKFLSSRDRVVLPRVGETRLAFFSEDIAGDQSAVSILDIFRPRAVPSVPANTDRAYDRVLSVSLNTYDERSQVYYERHGKEPTTESPVFTAPLTLMASDTVKAFVVDASGYRGSVDTFVYRIDLPPTAHFRTSPDTGDAGRPLTFDASRSVDNESPLAKLTFAWDWTGDGLVEEKRTGDPSGVHAYALPGVYAPRLVVTDGLGRTAEFQRVVLIRDICPEGMGFVAIPGARSFCIDHYEWPNSRGSQPRGDVTWVQAAMFCRDAGKRLCTLDEWQYSCKGGQRSTAYPYGSAYDPQRCPTEGEKVFSSGKFDRCGEGFGARDMVGNVWEWVDDREKHSPLMAGGSYQYGDGATCSLVSGGTLVVKSPTVGFRCCK